MTTGERIRAARIKKNWTQKKLGEECGMADSAIRRYESGRGNPTLGTLQRIADALDVDIYEIFNDEQRTTLELSEQFRKLGEVIRINQSAPIADIDMKKIERELGLDTDPVWLAGNQLLEAFDKLNSEGQQKAIERVEELAEIPKYKK